MKHSMIQTLSKIATISALSSNNLTGEDLGLKPSTVDRAKVEYSSLGKKFNNGLSEDDKKEGISKRLENIKGKNDELLNTINTTNKASRNKINKAKNQYTIQSIVFQSLRILAILKNCHSILCLI